MPNTLYVHVGLPKTGTTAIQRSLFASRRILLKHDIVYPGRFHNHTYLIARWHQIGLQHNFFSEVKRISPSKALKKCDGILDEIRAKSKHRKYDFVVSSEYLFDTDEVAFDQMTSFANHCGLTLKIICYVRNPILAAISSTQQMLKQSNLTLLELEARPRYMNSVPKIRTFLQYFGHKNLVLRNYDAALGGDVVSDFLRVVGFQGEAWRIKKLRTNMSLSMEGACIADAVNRRIRQDSSFYFPRKILMKIKGSKFTLPRNTMEALMLKSKPEMVWLKDEFNIVFDPVDLPEIEKVRPLTESEADMELNKLISHSGLLGALFKRSIKFS